MRHAAFEWDRVKLSENIAKHGISFDMAAEVLADPFGSLFHLDTPQVVNGEDRWSTLASHPRRREIVLVIVWTERGTEDRPVTRIISARKAEPPEREAYEQDIYPDRP